MVNRNSLRLKPASAPRFWRDAAFPFVELREIVDGLGVCYAPHTHETVSIGAITGGTSTYRNGRRSERVEKGSVVVINAGDVHACNPLDDEPWSYRMLYVDTLWLTRLQSELGIGGSGLRPYAVAATTDVALYRGLNRLCEILRDDEASHLEKECAALTFFSDTQRRLDPGLCASRLGNPKLESVAEYIKQNCSQPLRIEELSTVSGLSPSHLIRAFKKRYGMPPHAYQMNSRIEYCRAQLRKGRAIADVAADAGFSDQAHMQRTFKRFVAATPGQYIK